MVLKQHPRSCGRKTNSLTQLPPLSSTISATRQEQWWNTGPPHVGVRQQLSNETEGLVNRWEIMRDTGNLSSFSEPVRAWALGKNLPPPLGWTSTGSLTHSETPEKCSCRPSSKKPLSEDQPTKKKKNLSGHKAEINRQWGAKPQRLHRYMDITALPSTVQGAAQMCGREDRESQTTRRSAGKQPLLERSA